MSLLILTDPANKCRMAVDSRKLQLAVLPLDAPAMQAREFAKACSLRIREFAAAWFKDPLNSVKPDWVVYIQTYEPGQDTAEAVVQETPVEPPEVQP